MLLPIFILTILSIEHVFGATRIDSLVQTNLGLIKGLKATDGNYSMFLGIPYATVDRKNPFGASLPHPKFEDVFEAFDDTAVCPQYEHNINSIIGNLDCLQLNVFTPDSANSDNPLPVLVYIHGGLFQTGSFNRQALGPKFLVEKGIILVAMNYRLGPYGFMCLDTPEIPGNQGLKDQIKALKWVKDNIEGFGGDPGQVTILGSSAGGAAVDFHLMYPGERLFNKAILQSGVALTPARLTQSNNEHPLVLAEHFGLKTSDLNEALAFLSEIDTHLIIDAALQLNIEFRACVEKHFDGIEIFVPEHPAKAKRTLANNIQILIGVVDQESMIMYAPQTPEFFENLTGLAVFKNQLNEIFDFGDDLDLVQQNMKNFYIGDHELTENDKWDLIDFQSDFTYVHPTHRAMRKYLESGVGDVFFYKFKYDGGRNLIKVMINMDAPGAAHGDELGYLFDLASMAEEISPEDQDIIDKMTTMWSNFVKYGNPTPSPSGLVPVTWTPITPKKWHCLTIDSELALEGRPFHDRMAYWDLFFSMYGHLERGVE